MASVYKLQTRAWVTFAACVHPAVSPKWKWVSRELVQPMLSGVTVSCTVFHGMDLCAIAGLTCYIGSKSQMTNVATSTGLTPAVGTISAQTRLILLARILR